MEAFVMLCRPTQLCRTFSHAGCERLGLVEALSGGLAARRRGVGARVLHQQQVLRVGRASDAARRDAALDERSHQCLRAGHAAAQLGDLGRRPALAARPGRCALGVRRRRRCVRATWTRSCTPSSAPRRVRGTTSLRRTRRPSSFARACASSSARALDSESPVRTAGMAAAADSSSSDGDAPCCVCGSSHSPPTLNRCVLCYNWYHVDCHTPPLGRAAFEDDWYCSACVELYGAPARHA